MAVMVRHYLVYRVSRENWRCVDWLRPDGGLVLAMDQPMDACDVARQRYHTGPHEVLVVAAAETREQAWQATLLHQRWEADRSDFLDWMKRGKCKGGSEE